MPRETAVSRIGQRDIAAFARGCAVLGCGGGGGVALAERMLRDAVARSGPVRLVDLDELPAAAFVMPCGMLGSPLVLEEQLPTGDEPFELVAAVQEAHGRPVDALMPFQLAGANGVFPLAWAASLGLPLVDADGTGRPMPIMATAMGLAGVSPTPACVVDGHGQQITIRARTRERLTTTAIATLAGVGGLAAFAFDLMEAATARRATIRGSVTRALGIGRAALSRRTAVETVLTGGRVLARGRVHEVERYRADRRRGGSVLIEGVGTAQPRWLRLEFQNEFLLAVDAGRVVATVPDTIAVLDSASGSPLLVDEMREGQVVIALAGAGPEIWQNPQSAAVAGPAAFGLDLPEGLATPRGVGR
ncbi:DUF917 domain-containing protein [Pseudonocardia sichuanensis]